MQYISRVHWERHNDAFTPKTYDRTHQIEFGSGSIIEASSAPEFQGDGNLPNPEELFLGAIASCFMLTFLYFAALKGLIIDTYDAECVGTLGKNEQGKMAITEIILKPQVMFQDNGPDQDTLHELYKKAHENCFISNSVKPKITVQ